MNFPAWQSRLLPAAESWCSPKLRSWVEMDFKGSSRERLTLPRQFAMAESVLSPALIWADAVSVSS